VQTNIHDPWGWAPRIGIAEAPRTGSQKTPKTMIRAGFGIFYDRFPLGNMLDALRYNGAVQQQYVVNHPDFLPADLFPALPTKIRFGRGAVDADHAKGGIWASSRDSSASSKLMRFMSKSSAFNAASSARSRSSFHPAFSASWLSARM
jgi:hypothetical protein